MPETTTGTATTKTEVALETLAQDLAAVAAQQPIPHQEILTPPTVIETATPEENESKKEGRKKKTHTVMMLFIFLIILGIGYFFIYPMLKNAFSAQAIP